MLYLLCTAVKSDWEIFKEKCWQYVGMIPHFFDHSFRKEIFFFLCTKIKRVTLNWTYFKFLLNFLSWLATFLEFDYLVAKNIMFYGGPFYLVASSSLLIGSCRIVTENNYAIVILFDLICNFCLPVSLQSGFFLRSDTMIYSCTTHESARERKFYSENREAAVQTIGKETQ